MSVRAKALCTGAVKDSVGNTNVSMTGVYKGEEQPDGTYRNTENADFGTATPAFSVSMTIHNPDAAAQFEQGREYYVDFTPA